MQLNKLQLWIIVFKILFNFNFSKSWDVKENGIKAVLEIFKESKFAFSQCLIEGRAWKPGKDQTKSFTGELKTFSRK